MRTAESGRFAFYDVDGAELVLDAGGWRRRPTLIAIPAGPGFSHKTLRPWLANLALSVRAVHIDLPGTGYGSNEVDADYSFGAFVQDLDEIRSRVDAQQIALMGHGWGAAMAVEYALSHPEHISALLLVSPLRCFAAAGQDAGAQARQVERVDPTLGTRFAIDVMPDFEAALSGQGPWEPVEQNEWWGEMILTQFAHSPPPAWRTSLARERWGLRSYAAYKGAALLRTDDPMAAYDLAERATGLSREIAVLIVSSNHDANYVSKAHSHALPLHQGIPGSELLIWDDVGHFPFVERPADFTAVALDFLTRRGCISCG